MANENAHTLQAVTNTVILGHPRQVIANTVVPGRPRRVITNTVVVLGRPRQVIASMVARCHRRLSQLSVLAVTVTPNQVAAIVVPPSVLVIMSATLPDIAIPPPSTDPALSTMAPLVCASIADTMLNILMTGTASTRLPPEVTSPIPLLLPIQAHLVASLLLQ
jgi:hypothetical protein